MPSSLRSGSAIPRHEQLAVGLALAFAGGFFDAYTYLTRGGVFANAQTGNIVLMSLATARGRRQSRRLLSSADLCLFSGSFDF